MTKVSKLTRCQWNSEYDSTFREYPSVIWIFSVFYFFTTLLPFKCHTHWSVCVCVPEKIYAVELSVWNVETSCGTSRVDLRTDRRVKLCFSSTLQCFQRPGRLWDSSEKEDCYDAPTTKKEVSPRGHKTRWVFLFTPSRNRRKHLSFWRCYKVLRTTLTFWWFGTLITLNNIHRDNYREISSVYWTCAWDMTRMSTQRVLATHKPWNCHLHL